MDMTAVSAISNSLNLTLTITKAMLGVRDQAIMQEKVVELTSHIISAQQAVMAANKAQSDLSDRIRELEEEITRMKDWSAEKQRYELCKVWDGSFAYREKESMRGSEPPHWICTNCFQNGKRSIVQVMETVQRDARMNRWECNVCKGGFLTPMHVMPDSLPG